jgi:hypothetical protein
VSSIRIGAVPDDQRERETRTITKDEGIAKRVVKKALGGHVPSVRLVDDWRRQVIEKQPNSNGPEFHNVTPSNANR